MTFYLNVVYVLNNEGMMPVELQVVLMRITPNNFQFGITCYVVGRNNIRFYRGRVIGIGAALLGLQQ